MADLDCVASERHRGSWLAMTVAFEFGFGRAVAHQSWDQLLADYDLRSGRTWPIVLAWIALGPATVHRLRSGQRVGFG
jgi:hypothetical protein